MAGGTVGYRAPEVMTGLKADSRADVFAIGVVGYEMVMLRQPWDVAPPVTEVKIMDLLRRVGNVALDSRQCPDEPVRTIINRMLRTEADQRPLAGELLLEMQRNGLYRERRSAAAASAVV